MPASRAALPAPPKGSLSQQFCFTLYRASMAMTRTYKPMLDALGITYPQYLVLSALEEADGLSIGAIAQRLALESSTITPLARRMEQASLVQRRRGPENERQVHVWLTDSGKALLRRCSCLGETMQQRSGLSEEELTALNRRLQQVVDRLDAALGT
ncbi:MarR family winged helix-turn-helix transcriptional regulator [Pseudoroseomonas globiformis]|uniref:MarR family winged helix-turn-helix transcriptional regulator n=1 Tax=Teichococcus globiformis TaxID=2307229 RepID=A0ABV7G4B8_9PROT